MYRSIISAARSSCANANSHNYQKARKLFFLPALPVPGSLFRKKHKERKVVPFRPEQLYSVVADVESYKEFVPFCVDSRILTKRSECSLDAELAIGFKAFTERYTSRVTTVPHHTVCARSVNSRIFSDLTSTWKFSAGPSDNTIVDFTVEFEMKNPLAATAVSAFFQDVARQQVRAFERRCAHLYGHKAESRGLLPERKVGLQSSPFGLCDREEVRQGIARLRDALLRHATTVEGEGGQSGILLYDFQAACHELGQDMGDEGFGILSGDLALIAAVHSSVTFMLQRRRRVQIMMERKQVQPLMDEFVLAVYMMVQASSEDRARYLFYMIDFDGNGKLEREELQNALELYMKSVSQAIPQVILHHLREQTALKHNEAAAVLLRDTESLLARSNNVVKGLLSEIENEIPAAVDQVFERFNCKEGSGIGEEQWLQAWDEFPELLDLMSIQGMSKIVLFASECVDFGGGAEESGEG